jgi:hypothetical protein
MSFALSTSLSALITNAVAALFNFAAATTVKSVRLTNTHSTTVTVTLYFDYDGTAAAAVDTVVSGVSLAPGESVLVDGGPWNFAAASRISGIASVTNVVSVHLTPATI